jgi:hypothetical protein
MSMHPAIKQRRQHVAHERERREKALRRIRDAFVAMLRARTIGSRPIRKRTDTSQPSTRH